MSGVKRATVTNSLNKTMSLVRESLKQCAERAEKSETPERRIWTANARMPKGLR